MQGLIVCDDFEFAQSLRGALAPLGLEVPQSGILTLGAAVGAVRCGRITTDAAFVVLSKIEDAGLAIVQKLVSLTRAQAIIVGPADSPKHIFAAVRAGASDYIDIAGDLSDELRRVVQTMAHRNNGAARTAGRLITLTSASGGVGTSVLAANLATSIAAKTGSCGLLDFDLRGGDLASLLNGKAKHSVVDLCRNLSKLDAAMFEQSLTPHSSGVQLLAAPALIDDMYEVTVRSINRIVELANGRFPYTVVDLEDQFHKEQIRLLQLSDLVFLVMRLDFICLQNVHKCLNRLQNMGVEASRIELVVNRHGQPKELSFDQAESALGRKINVRIPDDPKTINATVNTGVPAVVEWPSSRVSRAINDWADSLMKRISTP
jgi:pilus assembly protein CpaE